MYGCTFSHMEWPAYAWPGGYPFYYVTRDGGCLCPSCANENMNLTLDKDYDQWCIVAQEINYEDNDLQCDNCYAVCPEPQVISPALEGAKKGLPPVILSRDCTTCGRCIDVCGKQVFKLTHRFDQRSTS